MNLDCLGQLTVLARAGGLPEHFSKIGSDVERVDIGHPVEVEVGGPDFLPQIATFRFPVGQHPFQVELEALIGQSN